MFEWLALLTVCIIPLNEYHVKGENKKIGENFKKIRTGYVRILKDQRRSQKPYLSRNEPKRIVKKSISQPKPKRPKVQR